MRALRPTLLLALLAAVSCDAPARPTVTEPSIRQGLQVDIVFPKTVDGTTAPSGGTLAVAVSASENGARLRGIGVILQFTNHTVVDSMTVHFAPRLDSTHIFQIQIPDGLPTNTQLNIIGIAFGTGDASVNSVPQSVIVIGCPHAGNNCT